MGFSEIDALKCSRWTHYFPLTRVASSQRRLTTPKQNGCIGFLARIWEKARVENFHQPKDALRTTEAISFAKCQMHKRGNPASHFGNPSGNSLSRPSSLFLLWSCFRAVHIRLCVGGVYLFIYFSKLFLFATTAQSVEARARLVCIENGKV